MTWAHFCEQSAQSRLATEQPYSSQAYEHLWVRRCKHYTTMLDTGKHRQTAYSKWLSSCLLPLRSSSLLCPLRHTHDIEVNPHNVIYGSG